MRRLSIISLIVISTSVANGQSSVFLDYMFRIKGTTDNVGRLVAYFNDGNSINARSYNNSTTSMIDLVLKDSLNKTYRLAQNKTYIEMPDPQLDNYKIKYVREEKTDTITYKVINVATHDSTNFNVVVWIKEEIKDYDSYMNGSVNSIDFLKLKLALNAKGLSGLPFKIGYNVSGDSYEYILSKHGRQDIDPSLFTLSSYSQQKPKTLEELYKEGKISEEQMKAMQNEQRKLMKKNRKRQ